MLIVKKIENNVLRITLEDIIKQVNNIQQYKWRLLWLYGTSSKLNVLDLEESINDSQNGKEISGEELIIFSRQFEQMLELLLIGDKDENKLKRYKKDEELKKECEFVIELVDGSYWEVRSKND